MAKYQKMKMSDIYLFIKTRIFHRYEKLTPRDRCFFEYLAAIFYDQNPAPIEAYDKRIEGVQMIHGISKEQAVQGILLSMLQLMGVKEDGQNKT